uniref:C2H2-type domain-containing protein n=1 Tax=Timema monikensis TaxID=170555 RepID=A0A7R9HUB4_9NEOP|nr:unnamed protein product [Timema monikensis]
MKVDLVTLLFSQFWFYRDRYVIIDTSLLLESKLTSPSRAIKFRSSSLTDESVPGSPSVPGFFPCKTCGEQFNDVNSALAHSTIHFDLVQCSICSAILSRRRNLKKHMLLVHSIKLGPHRRHKEEAGDEFSCGVCGKTFRHQISVKLHQTLHQGNTVCPLCGIVLSRTYSLKRHLTTVHGWILAPRQGVFSCSLCGKEFRHAGSLSMHQKLHRGHTRCPICEKVFSRAYYLKVHLQCVHKEEQNTDSAPDLSLQWPGDAAKFRCTECGKEYNQRSTLLQHKKVHSGKTTCIVCGRVLNRVRDLLIHMEMVHKIPRQVMIPRHVVLVGAQDTSSCDVRWCTGYLVM